MLSLSTDLAVLIDAEHVSFIPRAAGRPDPHPDAAGGCRARHDGDPVAAITRLLVDLPCRRLVLLNRLHLLLGYPWTHATVLPWQAPLLKADAWQEYALAIFADRGFNEVRLSEQVEIEDARFGKARLAVATNHTLVSALIAAAADIGWHIASCRDLLSATVVRHLRSLDRNCTLALVEPTALTCLFRRDGEWEDVTALPLSDNQSLDDALSAAALLSSRTTSDTTYVSATTRVHLPQGDGFVWLGVPHARLKEIVR